MTVRNSDAKKIANGTYIKVHEPSACETYASKNPSRKESIQAELQILRENFLGISDGTNVGGCILGSNVDISDGTAVVGISDGTNVGGCILGSNVDISDGTAVVGISDGALDGNEEATTGNGNESSDDDDNTAFVHPLAPLAQQSKEEKKKAKKLKKYLKIYHKEGAFMADLFENDGARYRHIRSKQKKNKEGTYLTDEQVEDQTNPYNTRRNDKK